MKKQQIKKDIGNFGESVAAKYLTDRGYSILDRNYRSKVGELDIVCEKDSRVHFIEVKTVMVPIEGELVRAEEHLDGRKIRKVSRLAGLYLSNKNYHLNKDYSIGAILVRLFKGRDELNAFPKNVVRITATHMPNIVTS